jgi:hypothetical protein
VVGPRMNGRVHDRVTSMFSPPRCPGYRPHRRFRTNVLPRPLAAADKGCTARSRPSNPVSCLKPYPSS